MPPRRPERLRYVVTIPPSARGAITPDWVDRVGRVVDTTILDRGPGSAPWSALIETTQAGRREIERMLGDRAKVAPESWMPLDPEPDGKPH